MDREAVIDATRGWVSSVVIGLNLCPFARRVFAADAIRYVVSTAEDEGRLLQDLTDEVKALASSSVSAVETTLLIHPSVLGAFLDYNNFLDAAELLIEELGLRDSIQLASFHPDYRFAGADDSAVENYTNRSPYPMLHLLREASVTAVAGGPVELLAIPQRNIETLRRLGLARILEKLKAVEDSSERQA